MGDLNMNLFNYESNESVADLLDRMCIQGFLACTCKPTRLTHHSKTLMDNTFHSGITNNNQSGNILTNISDYLSQKLSCLLRRITIQTVTYTDVIQEHGRSISPRSSEMDQLEYLS